jgi:hypothetical protein
MQDARGRERTCQEASPMSRDQYVHCGALATCVVDNGDERPHWMCEGCADHNVKNRGAVRWQPYLFKCRRCNGSGEVSCDSVFDCGDPNDGEVNCPDCGGIGIQPSAVPAVVQQARAIRDHVLLERRTRPTDPNLIGAMSRDRRKDE